MANTTNLNLKKPGLDESALITDINNDMDLIDAAVNGTQSAIAIVSTENTHAAIAEGAFVYIRRHSSLSEGLYTANSAISANTALTSSNVTAASGGALNTLNSNLTTVESKNIDGTYCYLYKKADVIFMFGHSAGGKTLTGDSQWHTLTTVDSGYRPRGDVYFSGANVGGKGISFHLASNGTLEYITDANTSYWNYSVSFPL